MALIIFSFFAVVINIQTHGWISWYRLTVFGEKTHATVTRREPGDHQTCYFYYAANSDRYEGRDQGCDLKVGQDVVVTYLPSDPSFVTASPPFDQLIFLVFGPFALSIFGGAMTVLSVFGIRKRNV